MLRSSNQSSGSSGRSHSHGGWMKNTHGDRGGKVPHWCGCGLRPILRWSGTDSNPEDHSMDALTIILPVRDGVAFLNGQMLKKKKP
ncbi:Zinc finger GRF-type protein [Arachis hypogaea]|nr:Zinc finger GRF-type protein [Arachis hypogaea]